ncbi:hypothetical protein IAT40_007914 [Kwoniella sp. CBS 6097]
MNANVGIGVPGIVSNLSAILAAAEAAAGQPVPQTTKRTYDEYRKSDMAMSDQAGIREIKRINSILPPIPVMGQKNIATLARNFINAHIPIPGAQFTIAEGRYVDKEREKATLVDRLCDFLGMVVDNSKRKDDQGNEIINSQTGKTQYMAVSTLKTYAKRVNVLMPYFAMPSFGMAELQKARNTISSFWITLAKLRNLTWKKRRVTTLFAADMKGLIETIFQVYEGKWDLAIQTAAEFLAFFYTGARPGSILATKGYPLEFSVWKDVAFRPVRDDTGKIISYDTYFTLKAFKGFRQERGLEVTFCIKSTQTAKYAVLDFGTYLIAHGLRRGVFGSRTLQDLLSTDKFEIRCDKEYENKPIFLAWASRSRLNDSWKAMTADAANRVLKDAMIRFGIATSKPFSDTLYAFRRGFATTVGRHLSPAIAKFFLGHEANSTMFERFYNQSNVDENITEGLLGPEEAQERVTTPLSFLRSEEGLEPPKITLKEALEIHPEFRHIKSKMDLLRKCLNSGSSQWLKVSPYKEMAAKTELSNASLPWFIGKQKSQLQRIVTRLRREKLTKDLDLQREADRELTYLEVQERREEAEKPSDLALNLQKLLIEREREMLEDKNSPTADVNMSINIDPDFEEPIDGEELENDADQEEPTTSDLASGAEDETTFKEGQTVYEYGELVDDSGGDVDYADPRGIELAQRYVQKSDSRETSDEVGQDRVIGVSGKQGDRPDQEAAEDQEDAQEQETAAADPIVDGPWWPSLTRPSSTLTGTQSEGGLPCTLCSEDPTATAEDKARLWPARQLWKKQRHDIQYHMPHPRWLRWFKHQIEDDKRFHCPYCTSTFSEQSRRAAFKHLGDEHEDQMDAELFEAMQNPDKAKQDVKKAIDTIATNQRPTTRFGKTEIPLEIDRYTTPGTLHTLDTANPKRARLGLGASLYLTGDILNDGVGVSPRVMEGIDDCLDI